MDIDDSTPEKIEANDQACAKEIEAVLAKWGRRIIKSYVAKTIKDASGVILCAGMDALFEVKKDPSKGVTSLTDEELAAKKAGSEAASVL